MRLFHRYDNKQMLADYDRLVDAIRYSEKFVFEDITKYAIEEYKDELLSAGVLRCCGSCQCLECGEFTTDIYFLERGTSNALCLECVEVGQEIDFSYTDLVYVE